MKRTERYLKVERLFLLLKCNICFTQHVCQWHSSYSGQPNHCVHRHDPSYLFTNFELR